jgi:hypothetical protein
MPQKLPKNWAWNRKREQAAALVAADRISDEKIAERVGISRKALWAWKQVEQFQARVRMHVAAGEARARECGIARKAQRLASLNEFLQALLQVRDERGADPAMQDVPGGRSGLLVRTLKQVGSGATAQVVAEFELDGTLLREVREYQQQAAKELGEFPGGAEAEGAPPIALAQVIVATREDAQLYMQRLYAQAPGTIGVVNPPPPAAPALPSSFKDALAQGGSTDERAAGYDGPDGI